MTVTSGCHRLILMSNPFAEAGFLIFLVSGTLNEGGTFILLNNKKITVYKYVYINRIRLLTGCFLRGNRTLFFHLKCYLCASNKKTFLK